MSMTEWANEEVRIACKKEAPDRKDAEWDYGCACYESALKAYLSLMADNHSGASFGFTANILKRLLESKPLTPIEDVPEVWNETTSHNKDGSITYQCRRMSSLFKTVFTDGTVKYHDISRCYAIDITTGTIWESNLENNLLDELHPITMPYYPSLGQYVFEVSALRAVRGSMDFDVIGIFTLRSPDGSTQEKISKYYVETEDGWKEITLQEYLALADLHNRWEAEINKMR